MATLSVGLYLPPAFRQDLLLFATVYSRLAGTKRLGLLPAHRGSTGTKGVHYHPGFMWFQRAKLSTSHLHGSTLPTQPSPQPRKCL